MPVNPVRWFEIYVQDMDRAKKFYETVFRTQLTKLDTPASGDYWTFPSQSDHPGVAGALVKMDGVPSGGMGTLVYFGCEDCAIESTRIANAGGRIKFEKMAIGQYGFIVLAFDTEDNMIGLHSTK
jgi:predicted enzyme related to lactoylglutathione lyase